MFAYRLVLRASLSAVFLLLLVWPVTGQAQARLVTLSQERQAVVLRDARGLIALSRDQTDPRLQLELQRVDAEGADLRFLGLPDSDLVVRVQRGTDLDAVRARLLQRPVVPKTVEVAIALDPTTGTPLTGPVRAPPPTAPRDHEDKATLAAARPRP